MLIGMNKKNRVRKKGNYFLQSGANSTMANCICFFQQNTGFYENLVLYFHIGNLTLALQEVNWLNNSKGKAIIPKEMIFMFEMDGNLVEDFVIFYKAT